MVDPSVRFRIARLNKRGTCYRWLWSNHDMVVEARETGDRTIWSVLTGMVKEDGQAVTSAALRQAWPKVEADWANASKEERAHKPMKTLTREAQPAPIAADRPRTPIFSEPSNVFDEDFPLTDLEGNKF